MRESYSFTGANRILGVADVDISLHGQYAAVVKIIDDRDMYAYRLVMDKVLLALIAS